jgi:putative membrane protein
MRRAAVGSFAVTAAAMVATPLCRRGGPGRRRLASAVVLGLAATTAANAGHRWGAARAGAAAAIVGAGTAVVERVGTATGLPFGRYRYTGVLRPAVGDVPAVVPAAWFAMALPARETAVAVLGPRLAARPVPRWLAGSALLTAWDLFLDPQMVGEGYWRWARRGRYRGIPLSNYLGWFVTGVAVMAVLDRVTPAGPPPAADEGPGAPADLGLVGEYAFMAAMETVGFAAFFRDRLVAAAGGTAMVPAAAVALWRTARRGATAPGRRR